MIKAISFTILLIMTLVACKDESTTRKANQYDLIFYTNETGPKPKEGEHVFFQMDILDDKKKELQTYRNQRQMPSLKIPPSESKSSLQNPIPAALVQMSVNDSVGIMIPSDSIPDLSEEYSDIAYLEYIIVLKEILSADQFQERIQSVKEQERLTSVATRARLPEVEALAQRTLAEFKDGKLEVKHTENGIEYYIHEIGGGDMPTKDRLIHAHYFGFLQSNGISFDNSFEKGRTYPFRLGRGAVIKGWDEGFMNFPIGTKASLFIPSEFAYGSEGSPPVIPADADLYFYVEVEEMYY